MPTGDRVRDNEGGASARGSSNRRAQEDTLFEAVRPIAEGIARTFGSMCEVVVHDYRKRSRSVVFVAGNLTNRKVGQSASSIGLRMIAQGDDAQDDFNYITRTEGGRVLKSTTILLRDRGHVIGALCINVDITEIRKLSHTLGEIAGDGLAKSPEAVSFSPDAARMVDDIVGGEETRLGVAVERMSRTERLGLLEVLNERGVFALRGSVSEVARRLGVSRATTYNYINDLASVDDGSATRATTDGAG